MYYQHIYHHVVTIGERWPSLRIKIEVTIFVIWLMNNHEHDNSYDTLYPLVSIKIIMMFFDTDDDDDS